MSPNFLITCEAYNAATTKNLDQFANARAGKRSHRCEGLVRGQQQQQRVKVALKEMNGRECLIVCLSDYASYLSDSLHIRYVIVRKSWDLFLDFLTNRDQ